MAVHIDLAAVLIIVCSEVRWLLAPCWPGDLVCVPAGDNWDWRPNLSALSPEPELPRLARRPFLLVDGVLGVAGVLPPDEGVLLVTGVPGVLFLPGVPGVRADVEPDLPDVEPDLPEAEPDLPCIGACV